VGVYEKIIDKARKLKALAERGKDGEMESAKRFYESFLNKNKISEQEVDSEYFKRAFTLADSEYEILLSHIIMSVNPFCVIQKMENQKFIVPLDDEDFVEVENKFMTFHNLFKKDEKIMLRNYIKFAQNDYEREKFLFLSGFMHFHQKHFEPDVYAVSKQRDKDNRNINPDMAQSVKDTVSKGEFKGNESVDDKLKNEILDEKLKDAQDNYDRNKKPIDNAPKPFSDTEVLKIMGYAESYTSINYVRAKKTLAEKY